MNFLREYNISKCLDEYGFHSSYKDKYNNKCFIYFLINENKVVYIGRTGDINLRLKTHFRNKQFNKVFLLYMRKYERAFQLEKRLIEAFVPKYNSIGRWKNRKTRNAICLIARTHTSKQCSSCKKNIFIAEIQRIKDWIIEKV